MLVKNLHGGFLTPMNIKKYIIIGIIIVAVSSLIYMEIKEIKDIKDVFNGNWSV